MTADVPFFIDLDGPILDVSARYYGLFKRLVERQGAALPIDRATYWAQKREGISSRGQLGRNGLAGIDADALSGAWVAEIESPSLLEDDTLQPFAVEALEKLLAERPLVLVTLRQDPVALRAQLEQLGLNDRFAQVLSGSPLDGPGHLTKIRLIEEAGVAFSGASWFVGDTEHDLRAGRLLAMRTCAVTCGIRGESLLRGERPDVVATSLWDFACRYGTEAGG